MFFLSLTPSSYVIRKPGPVFNLLPQHSLHDAKQLITFKANPHGALPAVLSDSGNQSRGKLNVMTVGIYGNPKQKPYWPELLASWLSPASDVSPMDAFFPSGTTPEQVIKDATKIMLSSQEQATAYALKYLKYHVDGYLVVDSVMHAGPSYGVLQAGDKINKINNRDIHSVQDIISNLKPRETDVLVTRQGKLIHLAITPALQGLADPAVDNKSDRAILGISVTQKYIFPFDISINLHDVGGPSAGMIFTLAIIDLLTPGDLTGGKNITGSGTVNAMGEVGPIGGIKQKLRSAEREGADYFIASSQNCKDAIDAKPKIPVFAVDTIEDALDVIKTQAEGLKNITLKTCNRINDININ